MGRYLAFDAFWISGMGYCEYLCRDLCVHTLIPPGHVPRSGTAGSYGNNSFEELPACIQSAAAFLFRQQCRRLLAFCTVASTVCLLDYCPCVRCEVLAHELDLHFFRDLDAEHLPRAFAHFCIFLPTGLL